MSASESAPAVPRSAGIDPRAPRFAASLTALLLAIGVFLSLLGTAVVAGTTLAERVSDPAFLLLLVIDLLFVWGFASPRTAPFGVLFRALVRPRLQPPVELEDPRPPRFAQLVGFFVVTVGMLLHLIGVPWALPIAASAAFVAAFLNAAFGLCLGCELYLLLARARIIRPQGGPLAG